MGVTPTASGRLFRAHRRARDVGRARLGRAVGVHARRPGRHVEPVRDPPPPASPTRTAAGPLTPARAASTRYCDPGNMVRHHHLGSAFYRKNVTLPPAMVPAHGSRLFVVFEGVSRALRCWVDGAPLAGGTWKTGQNSAHEFELTQHVLGRQFLLAVEVTNKANCASPGPVTRHPPTSPTQRSSRSSRSSRCPCGADTLGDCLGGKMNNLQMGGLWGSVRLELRPAAFLEHVFVQPIFDRSLQGAARYRSVTLNVSATLRGGSGGAAPHLALEVERWNSSAAVQLSRPPLAQSYEYSGARDGDTISGLVTVHSPDLWHPDATALYVATVRLVTGVDTTEAASDVVVTRFGIK